MSIQIPSPPRLIGDPAADIVIIAAWMADVFDVLKAIDAELVDHETRITELE